MKKIGRITKVMSMLIVCCMVTMLLIGCKGTETTKDVPKDDAAKVNTELQQEKDKAKPVHITFWDAIPEESGPQNAIDAWNAEHPEIQVEYVRYVNDENGNTKLDTALLSGQGVDIFVSHGPDRTVGRITAELAEPLTDFLSHDNINVEEMFGAGYYNYNDKVYGIPHTNPADFIWLNKNMFDEANIEIPTEWTYDEFREIAKKLTKGSGAEKVYGAMIYPGWPDGWMKSAYSILGPNNFSEDMAFDLDNEYFKKALQLRYDMEVVDQSWVPTVDVVTQKLTIQDMYFNEKVAMIWAGSFPLRYLKSEADYPHDFVTAFAPVPKWDKNQEGYYNPAGASDGVVSINKLSQHKEKAWEFIKWYTTEGFATYCSPFGKIPSWVNADKNAMQEGLLDTEYTRMRIDLESFNRVFIGDTITTGEFFVTPLTDARREIATMMAVEVDKCLLGEQNVDETIEKMKAEAVKICNR